MGVVESEIQETFVLVIFKNEDYSQMEFSPSIFYFPLLMFVTLGEMNSACKPFSSSLGFCAEERAPFLNVLKNECPECSGPTRSELSVDCR